MERVEELSKTDGIETYTNIALQYIPIEKWVLTLMYVKINPFQALPYTKSMIDNMLQENRYETAFLYVLNFLDALPPTYDDILHTLWQHVDSAFMAAHIDTFMLVIERLLLEEDTNQSEQKLTQLIVKLLETYDLQAVHKTLLPVQQSTPHSPIMKKINKMITLLQDPNNI